MGRLQAFAKAAFTKAALLAHLSKTALALTYGALGWVNSALQPRLSSAGTFTTESGI